MSQVRASSIFLDLRATAFAVFGKNRMCQTYVASHVENLERRHAYTVINYIKPLIKIWFDKKIIYKNYKEFYLNKFKIHSTLLLDIESD